MQMPSDGRYGITQAFSDITWHPLLATSQCAVFFFVKLHMQFKNINTVEII